MGLLRNEEQATQEQATQEQDFYDAYAGMGCEDFTPDTVNTAYLSIVQPSSAAASEQEPGTWRNSATGANYGKKVEVVVLAFKTVWTERDKNPPYTTVGRYEPNSIPVDVEYPKPGQRGFPKMMNTNTGNKIEELFIYACMLPDHPEDGVLYFSPTSSSMKTCKQWNSMLRSQRLPSGKLAPRFAFSWILELDLLQNPKQPGNPNAKIAKFIRATRGKLVAKDLFMSYVQPQLESANSSDVMLLAAPETSGDDEEE